MQILRIPRVADLHAPSGEAGVSRFRRSITSATVCALLVLSIWPINAHALTVTLQEWMSAGELLSTALTVAANNSLCCGGNSDTLMPDSLPYSSSHAVSSDTAAASTSYDFSNAGFAVQEIAHSRPRRASASSQGVIFFSIDLDALYHISGSYGFVGLGWREIQISAWLFDLTAGVELFQNSQQSGATANESFLLGEEGGDSFNSLSGSLVGELLAGHIYRFTYFTAIGSSEAGDDNASAAGNIHLAVVPEPGSGTLLLVGLFAMGVFAPRSNRSEAVRCV